MSAVSFMLHVTTGAIKIIEIHNLEAVVWWRSKINYGFVHGDFSLR